MIALISDIHANLSALEAVLADIHSLGSVRGIYCLGDVVGYGPQPLECFELLAQHCKVILLGNHEYAVLHGTYGFSGPARRAIEWTRETFEQAPGGRGKRLLQVMAELPTSHQAEDVLLVHGSPRDHVMEYVLESDTWEGAESAKMQEIFALIPRLCFAGHTHRPGIFTQDGCFLTSEELPSGFRVDDGARYLINVGSVGQPRDRDTRACYAVYSGQAIYFRRVPYDIDRTAALIRANARLDERLALRLYRGE